MRNVVALTLVLFSPAALQTAARSSPPPAQTPAYSVEDVHAVVVSEIRDPSIGIQRVKTGSIVEITAKIAPAVADKPAAVDVSEIKLSGEEVSADKKVSWTFEPIGIGVAVSGKCSYYFHKALVRGEVGLDHGPAGEYSVKREMENSPTLLTVKRPSSMCLAFPAPGAPEGSVSLQFGAVRSISSISR